MLRLDYSVLLRCNWPHLSALETLSFPTGGERLGLSLSGECGGGTLDRVTITIVVEVIILDLASSNACRR
jgi:hypothetical protein